MVPENIILKMFDMAFDIYLIIRDYYDCLR